ncbi:unnamed protein product, partial [Cyprideis torosa]
TAEDTSDAADPYQGRRTAANKNQAFLSPSIGAPSMRPAVNSSYLLMTDEPLSILATGISTEVMNKYLRLRNHRTISSPATAVTTPVRVSKPIRQRSSSESSVSRDVTPFICHQLISRFPLSKPNLARVPREVPANSEHTGDHLPRRRHVLLELGRTPTGRLVGPSPCGPLALLNTPVTSCIQELQ